MLGMTERVRPRGFWIAAAWALFLLPGLPALDVRYCFEWDSAQYARAIHDYNVAAHQPHPSGFPLYVLLLRALYPLCGNEPRAMACASLLMLAPGVWFLRKLAREVAGETWGEGVALLVAFAPLVSLHAFAQTNYTADFTASAVLGWCALRLRRGEARRAPHACLAWALFGGLRYSGALALMPLLGYALWPHRRRAWPWAVAALALLALFHVPAVETAGGWQAYRANSRANALAGMTSTSVWFGAPGPVHRDMMVTETIWVVMGLGLLPVLALAGRRGSGPGALFLALWAAPNFLVTFLLHGAKPGYQMLVLPALAVALAGRLRGLAPRWIAAGCVAELALSWLPFLPPVYDHFRPHNENIYRALPGVLYEVEARTGALAVQVRALPPGTPVHAPTPGPMSPNFRTVTFDLPDVRWVPDAEQAQAGYGPGVAGRRVEFWRR